MRVYNHSQQRVVVPRLEVAHTRQARARGLIGHAPLEPDQGMLIKSSRWIHSFGMAFPIDIVYLGRDGRVVACSQNLVPSRIDRPVWRAQHVLELPAGAIVESGVQVGDHLEVQP